MKHSRLWTWHILAGLVILVLLGLHMVIMHLDDHLPFAALNPAGGEGIHWDNVVARAKMGFFMVSYVVLLGAALFHGLYGLNTVIGETNLRAGLKRCATACLATLGVALFVVGTYAAIAARAMATKG
jgi:succinate dehydrogenase / fumarate reductase membrane anchor subunit